MNIVTIKASFGQLNKIYHFSLTNTGCVLIPAEFFFKTVILFIVE